MTIYKVLSHTRTKVGEVGSYTEARSFLAKIGKIVAFETDTFAGGADALVIPTGQRFVDQYDISI